MSNNFIERSVERCLFSSRWLMAPIYMGLAGAMMILLYSFMRKLINLFYELPTLNQTDVLLGILSLIDLSLAGNLLIIVVISGYENFVSKIDTVNHKDEPEWKGKIGFSDLKLKLIASIVAISGIHLLEVFMEIEKVSETKIRWMVIIHIVFVFSGVLLALMDYLASIAKSAKNK